MLLPVSVFFDYVVGTSFEWTFGTFVELAIVSVLYALLTHYFGDRDQSPEEDSSEENTTEKNASSEDPAT